jgi:ribosomal-protein-alanine N-acetyltransferase
VRSTFIGWCSLNRWNPDYRSASLGYCYRDAAWGPGYATEAARALLRWAFDTLDPGRRPSRFQLGTRDLVC